MIPGRFVPLGEDWNCDQCSAEIRSSLYAFVFESGQEKGQCYCVKCVTDSDFDGGGEFQQAWECCPGFYEATRLGEAYPNNTRGLPGQDHSKDGTEPGPRSYDSNMTRWSR